MAFLGCTTTVEDKEAIPEAEPIEAITVEEEPIQEWNHTINWFEIPVSDLERAVTFYETVLNIRMEIMSDTAMGGYSMAFFAEVDNSTIVSGALMQFEGSEPSDKGTVVYLNASPDLNDALGRIEDAGGKVIMPKSGIGENNEHGFMALFIDTEGNKVALHSME